MAKSLEQVLRGIFCCIDSPEAKCDDCTYRSVYDCKNVLRNDISYWAKAGELEICKDGSFGLANIPEKKVKCKRKNGRRYSDGERRKGRHEQYGELEDC